MSLKPKRLEQVYKKNSHFQWLASRAQQLNKLNIILQKNLPLEFTNHCQLANINTDRVIVHTDKATYASLLRFHAPQICVALSAHLPEPVSRLEVKVRPLTTINRPKAVNDFYLSMKTAALIESTAAGIENDQLRAALNKLAKRGSNSH